MAHATRYYGRLKSADSYAYQAHLRQDGFVGTAEEVTLTDSPLSVDWGKKGADAFVPILGSVAKVQNWRLPSGSGLLSALIGAKVGEWELVIYRASDHATIDAGGGTLYWRGRILSDIFQDSTMGGASEVDVEAIDGLGVLKDVPYYDTTTTPGERLPYEGRVSLLTVLRTALGKLGYHLPVRSALAFRPSGKTGDPLSMAEIDQASFYSDEGEAMTCYDVVLEVSKRFTAQLRLHCQDGDTAAWWLVSRELLTGTAYTAYRYTDAGVVDGTMTAGAAVDGDAADRISGHRSFRAAYGAAKVVHNHGVIPPLVSEGTYGATGGHTVSWGRKYRFKITVPISYHSHEWTYVGAAALMDGDPEVTKRNTAGVNGRLTAQANVVHGVEAKFLGTRDTREMLIRLAEGRYYHTSTSYVTTPSYAEARGGTASAGQTLAFGFSVKITRRPGTSPDEELWMPYWMVTLDGDDGVTYNLTNAGGWDTATTDADRLQELIRPTPTWGERGIDLETQVPMTYVTDPAPATGPITVRLYGTGEPGNAASDELDAHYVQWDNVAVLVSTPTGEALAATATEVWTTDAAGMPVAEPERPEIVCLLGEGPSQELPTQMTWNGAATASDWVSTRLTTPRALDLLHAETVLRSHAAPVEAREERYRNLGASTVAPVTIGGVPYAPVYLSKNVYHGEDEVELLAVAFDGGLSVTSEAVAADPPGTTYSPGVTGVGSPQGTGAAGTVVGAVGDLIVGGESSDSTVIVETRHPIGTAGQVLTVDEAEPLKIAWKDAAEVPESTPLVPVIGRATIPDGSLTITVTPGVTFHPYSVQVSPLFDPQQTWGIVDVSTTRFTIQMSGARGQDQPFNWGVHPLSIPAITDLAVSDSGVDASSIPYATLTWSAVTLADGYTVYWDTDSGEPYANAVPLTLAQLTDNLDGTYSYTVSGLTLDVEHFFAVTATRTF